MPEAAPKAVAIVRFGAAGDVLLTTPIVLALRALAPHLRLVMVTHARNRALLSGVGELDDIVCLQPGESVRSLQRRLRRHNIAMLLDLHGSLRSRLLALLMGPNVRKARWVKRTLAETLAHRLAHAPYRPQTTQLQRYAAALERLVGAPIAVGPHVHRPHPDHLAEGHRALSGVADGSGVPHGLIVLNPGAAWATKRWPVTHFVALARRLLACGHRVLAIGSPNERALVEEIVAGAPGVRRLAHETSLAGLAGVFAHAAVLVSGDSGPMHMARGMGVPCVVLFGSTPAEQFALDGHRVVRASVGCSPCSFFGRSTCPRGHLACMNTITPEQVFEALRGLVQSGGVA